jgi:hypothetical protein
VSRPQRRNSNEAEDPAYVKPDTTSEMENPAEIRAESPKQLEKTIEEIEDSE